MISVLTFLIISAAAAGSSAERLRLLSDETAGAVVVTATTSFDFFSGALTLAFDTLPKACRIEVFLVGLVGLVMRVEDREGATMVAI